MKKAKAISEQEHQRRMDYRYGLIVGLLGGPQSKCGNSTNALKGFEEGAELRTYGIAIELIDQNAASIRQQGMMIKEKAIRERIYAKAVAEFESGNYKEAIALKELLREL